VPGPKSVMAFQTEPERLYIVSQKIPSPAVF